MNDRYDFNIGAQIKHIRKQLGFTLRVLSNRSGLSINAISRIENHQTSPTVNSVHRIAQALGVPIASLFDETIASNTVYVQATNRKKIHMKGRTLELLGPGMIDPQCEPFYVTLVGNEKTTSDPGQHPGEEFAYCLEGEIIFYVGGIRYHLREGDSLFFKSDQPHTWENPTRELAKFLLFFVAEEGKKTVFSNGHNKIIEEYVPSENTD